MKPKVASVKNFTLAAKTKQQIENMQPNMATGRTIPGACTAFFYHAQVGKQPVGEINTKHP